MAETSVKTNLQHMPSWDQIQWSVPDWETNSLYKLGRSVKTRLNILKVFGLSDNITDKNSGAQTVILGQHLSKKIQCARLDELRYISASTTDKSAANFYQVKIHLWKMSKVYIKCQSYPEACFMGSRRKWLEVFWKWSGSSHVHQACCSQWSQRSRTHLLYK